MLSRPSSAWLVEVLVSPRPEKLSTRNDAIPISLKVFAQSIVAAVYAARAMLENNCRQPALSALGKSQLAGDCDRFAVLVAGQELLIRQGECFNGANLRSRRQILQTRFRYRQLSPHETQNHRSYPNYACHRSLLVVCL